MLFTLSEHLMRLAGYRKMGTIERPEVHMTNGTSRFATPRPIRGGTVNLGEYLFAHSDNFDLSGNPEIDQGATSACACATICAMLEDWIVRTQRETSISVNWETMWEDMKFSGIASEEQGSYLQDNIWYMQNVGVRDNLNRLWKVSNVERIPKINVIDYLEAGHQIYTGAMIHMPMTDRNFVFRTGGRTGGHAFRLIGMRTRDSRKRILAETTWKDYGLKKESQFLLEKPHVDHLYSCYVMEFAQA